MKKRTLICVVAAASLTIAGAGCSNARGTERDADKSGNGSGDTVTVTGCLSSGQDGRFALTAAPGAAVAATARAMDDEANTYSYMLVGGENLQAHLGKRVEVKGTVSGKKQDLETKDTKKTESAPAVSGGDTPTVKTEEEIDVEVRQLNVREIRDLAPTCSVNP